MLNKRLITALLFIFVAALLVTPALAQDDLMGDFTVSHYFGGFGGEFIDEIVDGFIAANHDGLNRDAASPVDHEQFKDFDPGPAGWQQPARYLQLLGRRPHPIHRRWRAPATHWRHLGS